jgi:hypothetical protein
MNLSRRKLLTGVAPGAALVAAGCTTAQIQNFQANITTVIEQVSSIVSQVAQYIPDADAVINAVVAIFGPNWEAAVAAGELLIQQVIAQVSAALEAAVANQTPPAAVTPAASHRFGARLGARMTIMDMPLKSGEAPIGYTPPLGPHNVVIHVNGYH